MDDCIVIKPSKERHGYYILCFAVLILAGVVVAVAFSIIFGIVLSVVFGLLLFLDYFANEKTLFIMPSGICAKFGRYKKMYNWSDFKNIHIQNYISHFSTEAVNEAMIFSEKKNKKPVWMSNKAYATIHPFSFIYISFRSENFTENTLIRSYGPVCYLAEKEDILRKLNEYGVKYVS